MEEKELKITCTRGYVDVETDDCIGRFSGEPCSNYFGAAINEFSWIKYKGKTPDADKMKLIFEVMKNNRKNGLKVLFSIFSVRELVKAMEAIPDLIGNPIVVNDTVMRWELSNGINISFRLNECEYKKYPVVHYRDWCVNTSFVVNGKEIELEKWHLDADRVWEVVVAVQNGELIWVTKKKLFGKVSLPMLMKKEAYDRLRNKDVYTVLLF